MSVSLVGPAFFATSEQQDREEDPRLRMKETSPAADLRRMRWTAVAEKAFYAAPRV
jgi:hypothetical protein